MFLKYIHILYNDKVNAYESFLNVSFIKRKSFNDVLNTMVKCKASLQYIIIKNGPVTPLKENQPGQSEENTINSSKQTL
jgi:hypothetical protein